MPEAELARHDVTEIPEGMEDTGERRALVPVELLNRLGRSQVYDHYFAGSGRRDLVRSLRRREETGDSGFPTAQMIRDAIAFFDRIGWLTPVKLQEQA